MTMKMRREKTMRRKRKEKINLQSSYEKEVCKTAHSCCCLCWVIMGRGGMDSVQIICCVQKCFDFRF